MQKLKRMKDKNLSKNKKRDEKNLSQDFKTNNKISLDHPTKQILFKESLQEFQLLKQLLNLPQQPRPK